MTLSRCHWKLFSETLFRARSGQSPVKTGTLLYLVPTWPQGTRTRYRPPYCCHTILCLPNSVISFWQTCFSYFVASNIIFIRSSQCFTTFLKWLWKILRNTELQFDYLIIMLCSTRLSWTNHIILCFFKVRSDNWLLNV